MATSSRSRTIAAAPQALWEVIDDPHHLPRWWPGVTRVEGVTGEQWTEVFLNKKGRPVRIDFRLVESQAPGTPAGTAGRRAWEQEIPGTPFERVFEEAVTEIVLEPRAGGTHVTIDERLKLKGYSRTGGWMLRRARAKTLNEALEGLERISVSPTG
jgi:uncharacterized protein YndB with AHSA1/START domain